MLGKLELLAGECSDGVSCPAVLADREAGEAVVRGRADLILERDGDEVVARIPLGMLERAAAQARVR